MFKKLKSVKLSYERQGFVRFACLTYDDHSDEMKGKILNLCILCFEEKYQALFELMTTSNSAISIAERHFTSESTLYRARKNFYLAWYDDKFFAPKKPPEIGKL